MAEDVAQAAFLKAWQEIECFGGEAAFGTWLYRIATNFCLDHLQKTARFRPVLLGDLTATISDESDVAEMVVVAAEREERQVLLNRTSAALPTEDRLLLALRVGEQLS